MNEQQRVDRRIQRTRQLLSEALFALIVQQGYEAITIQDITEQANLGRSTFYLHYRSKEELLADSVKDLINGLRKNVEPQAGEVCPYYIRSIRVFEHIKQHRALYQTLLGNAGPPGIATLMRKYFAELFQRTVLAATRDGWITRANPELLAAHAAGAFLGLILWWLEHDLTQSAEEMGNLYWSLMETGIEKEA